MTESIPAFVVRMLSVTEGLTHNPGRMLLIVRQPYAQLAERLRRAFEGRDDIVVIADRRRGDRRASGRPIQDERRRRTERRSRKEEILEVVIEGDAE
jgi:hypothetical protein